MNAPQQKIFNLGFVPNHFSCLKGLPETFSVSVLLLDFRFVVNSQIRTSRIKYTS